jgi:hypothetical protein
MGILEAGAGPVGGKLMLWMIRKFDTECDFLTKIAICV